MNIKQTNSINDNSMIILLTELNKSSWSMFSFNSTLNAINHTNFLKY
jgi:hypothetical protein